MTFKLIVLGPGYGETILVRSPEGGWGMIDCWFEEAGYGKFQDILVREQIEKLEFLCLTHFHLDHYQGMSRILEDYTPKQFWYPAVGWNVLKRYHAYISCKGKNQNPDSALKAEELTKIIRSLKEKRAIERKPIQRSQKRLYEAGGIKIYALSPSPEVIESYTAKRFSQENLLSITLAVELADQRIILGGDTGQYEWERIRSERRLKKHTTCIPLVKISHHGSAQGMGKPDWERFTACDPPQNHTGVLAPNLSNGLPKMEVINELVERGGLDILSTFETAPRMERYRYPKHFTRRQKTQLILNFNDTAPRKFEDSGWYLQLDSDGKWRRESTGSAVKYPKEMMS